MNQGPFQRAQRAFVKQILVLFVIILVSIPKVYGDDDDWIDGITYRYKSQATTIDIDYNRPFHNDEDDSLSIVGNSGGVTDLPEHLQGDPIESAAFPVTLEFKEKLMTSWSFRSAYLDWTFNEKYEDLLPNSSSGELINASETSDSLVQYLRQPAKTRKILTDNFFNSSDKEFTDANPNWALSADVKYSTIMIGYFIGVFYPAYNGTHRWFKLGLGIGVFAAQLQIDYNLCSAYILTSSKDADGRASDKKQARCADKKNIDRLNTNGVGSAQISSLTLWERKTNDSIWRLISFEQGTTNLNLDKNSEKGAFGLEKHDSYFVPSLRLQSLTVVSYTSLF